MQHKSEVAYPFGIKAAHKFLVRKHLEVTQIPQPKRQPPFLFGVIGIAFQFPVNVAALA
jgi:hypothetical protein